MRVGVGVVDQVGEYCVGKVSFRPSWDLAGMVMVEPVMVEEVRV